MAKAKAKVTPKKVDWNAVLENLQSGNSDWLFLKVGTTRLRLLQSPLNDLPFVEVTTNYKGNTRTKYMILAFNAEDEEVLVKGLVIPKTVFKSLTAMLADGFDFFHPVSGYGITIMKTGSGFGTEYSVLPSKKSIEVPTEILTTLGEFDLSVMGAEFDEQQKNRDQVSSQIPDEAQAEVENLGADW